MQACAMLPELGTIKKSNEIITEKDMEYISELKRDGYSLSQLDRAYSRSAGTIGRYYRKYIKGEFYEHRFPSDFDYGKLGALIKAGWNLKNIALEFKTDEKEIIKRIKELNSLCKK